MTMFIPKQPMVEGHLPAAQLKTWLRTVGHDVPCVDVRGDSPGACRGCAHQDRHPGFCVVNVVHDPGAGADVPEDRSDLLCLVGLPTYLAVTRDEPGFVGCSIEVIVP